MSKDAKKVPALRFKGFSDAWEKRKLGQIAEILMGQSPDSKNYTTDPKDYILVQGNADIKNGWVYPRVWTTQVTKIAKKGSVLLSVRAPVGEVARSAFDVVLGRGVASIGHDDFLYHYLVRMKENGFWLKLSTGSTFDSINSKDIKEAALFVPEKPEQQKISRILNSLNHLIAATQQKIDNLERTKKALRRRIFDQSLRLKGYSDLWENHRLGELANIQGGGTPSTSKSEYWNGSIDWYAPAEIGTRRYVSGSKRRITELGLQKSSAVLLPANKTILFTSRAGIGNAAILTKTAATNQGFQSIVVKQNADIYFLFSKIPEIKHKAIRLAAGSTFLEISGKSLSKIQIKVPNHDEQSKIGKVFLQMDNLIDLTQSKLAGLKLLKQAMLENLFV
ncbi:restriction endonuclease subunit S [Lacticaseibacillus zeae]|uniref:Restriction endonuclease subunit S n=1 Tax=Lacticaseibacillus zeae TaxID=57037 RepID=A0A5R8LSY6_LACZE|nr:restriction endonuclease subunit S [Lacticaseibacillus zeae]TLF40325.1 restriction endonuclease subunit S [Lacticaseibacillus zeae]